MNIVDLIIKKKDKKELSKEEIEFIIKGFVDGDIKDYQMSSLLMAITINGMTDDETIDLTKSIINSGEIIELSLDKAIVDKHSTGGVGDKTTLIVLPIVASCNVSIAKMSGRGLGHTGGTIDKLESIKGFIVDMDKSKFVKQIQDINVAIISQTNNIAPADKLIYALRDVTGTTSSIPLIASSIMSKKISSGADVIVLDVKVGKGALINNFNDAKYLASLMVKIGKSFNKKTIALITNMNNPLGNNIGNSLEVIEAMDILKNNIDNRLKELCIEISSHMVSLGKGISLENAKKEVMNNLENKNAYNKFIELINYQNGDINSLKIPSKKNTVCSKVSGYINSIDALELGSISILLGAGRIVKDDNIDYNAGLIIKKNVGDYVNTGDVLIEVYTQKEIDVKERILNAYKITKSYNNEPLIYEIIK